MISEGKLKTWRRNIRKRINKSSGFFVGNNIKAKKREGD